MTGRVWDSAVIGLGKTGASCVRYLQAQGERILAVDSRVRPPCVEEVERLSGVHCVTGGFAEEELGKASRLVFSPGVDRRCPPFTLPELKALPTTGDIQLFAIARQALPHPGGLIAVTGTNGKSTVTALIAHLLKACGHEVAVGGNTEVPALDLLAETSVDFRVLELSSFQLELVETLGADVAVLLNVAADHLDRYDEEAHYREVKKRIFTGARYSVFNRDDKAASPPSSFVGRRIPVTRSPVATDEDEFRITGCGAGEHLQHRDGWNFPLADLLLAGAHNRNNASLAVAAAHVAGGKLEAFTAALKAFHPLAHCCRVVAEKGGVTFINDSKATNVAAVKAALIALADPGEARILLLLGGDAKRLDFQQLTPVLRGRVRLVSTFGRDGGAIALLLRSVVRVDCHDELQEAFAVLVESARPGDVVLLSPGCASLDQFSGYRARGRLFEQLVLSLPAVAQGA